MPSLYQKIAAVVVACITLQMSVQHGPSKDAKTPRTGQVYAPPGLTHLERAAAARPHCGAAGGGAPVVVRGDPDLATEALLSVPYAFELRRQCKAVKVQTAGDRRWLYYFGVEFDEAGDNSGEPARKVGYPAALWTAPDFKTTFSNTLFACSRPMLVVIDAPCSEGCLPASIVSALADAVSHVYCVVYAKVSREGTLVVDGGTGGAQTPFEQRLEAREHPEVSTVGDLIARARRRHDDVAMADAAAGPGVLLVGLLANAAHVLTVFGPPAVLPAVVLPAKAKLFAYAGGAYAVDLPLQLGPLRMFKAHNPGGESAPDSSVAFATPTERRAMTGRAGDGFQLQSRVFVGRADLDRISAATVVVRPTDKSLFEAAVRELVAPEADEILREYSNMADYSAEPTPETPPRAAAPPREERGRAAAPGGGSKPAAAPYWRPVPPGVADFYVNPAASSDTDTNCTSWKPFREKITFDSEFGIELIMATPYVYSLHTQCFNVEIESVPDTQALYFFSSNYKFVKGATRDAMLGHYTSLPMKQFHVPRLPDVDYLPPPYKAHFANNFFKYDKPLLIITNKYQVEWQRRPINHIPLESLQQLVTLLSKKYTIIYCRPTNEIVQDDSKNLHGYDDKQQLKGRVLFIEDLWKQAQTRWGASMGGELTYNLFQFWVFANCDKYISVQGGNSVVTAYMAGKNGTVIVHARAGHELRMRSIPRWYGQFSGATMVEVHQGAALVREAVRRFLPDDAARLEKSGQLPPLRKMYYRHKTREQGWVPSWQFLDEMPAASNAPQRQQPR
ncbi:hypothetical protein DIPPA_12643 [Diplonema papillatum]|nr:hypothetical protein DIPPA_12643 [Diplonema papillatum]